MKLFLGKRKLTRIENVRNLKQILIYHAQINLLNILILFLISFMLILRRLKVWNEF